MRRIASILTICLIASTAAAQPWPPSERYPVPYDDRSYDDERFYDRAPDGRRWQELLVRPTNRPDVNTVVFRGRGGRLSWLMIPERRGISHVVIHYRDRQPEVIDRRVLRETSGVIQLDRRARIVQIDVFSRRPYAGPSTVFGA
jgi:hypothetical protein